MHSMTFWYKKKKTVLLRYTYTAQSRRIWYSQSTKCHRCILNSRWRTAWLQKVTALSYKNKKVNVFVADAYRQNRALQHLQYYSMNVQVQYMCRLFFHRRQCCMLLCTTNVYSRSYKCIVVVEMGTETFFREMRISRIDFSRNENWILELLFLGREREIQFSFSRFSIFSNFFSWMKLSTSDTMGRN